MAHLIHALGTAHALTLVSTITLTALWLVAGVVVPITLATTAQTCWALGWRSWRLSLVWTTTALVCIYAVFIWLIYALWLAVQVGLMPY